MRYFVELRNSKDHVKGRIHAVSKEDAERIAKDETEKPKRGKWYAVLFYGARELGRAFRGVVATHDLRTPAPASSSEQ